MAPLLHGQRVWALPAVQSRSPHQEALPQQQGRPAAWHGLPRQQHSHCLGSCRVAPPLPDRPSRALPAVQFGSPYQELLQQQQAMPAVLYHPLQVPQH